MTEQAQVGDTIRLTITIEGVAKEWPTGRLSVGGVVIEGNDRTVKILSRATPPLPDGPNTFWLDKWDDVWVINPAGVLYCLLAAYANPNAYAPFRQLVLK